ncbi:MAG: UDP-glucose 4-epimerase [Bradymonadia bacterium]|jgi:UDP-glucose 4-epimerase
MISRRRQRRPTIVVTGIASRFGRMVTRQLHEDADIIGIDGRGAGHIPSTVTVHALDLRRRDAEDVFRRNNVDAVLHMTRVQHSSRRARTSTAVEDAIRVMALCHKYDVPKLVVVSTASVYGPNPGNSQFLTEEAPLMAGHRFVTLRDRVEIDMYASTWFWRHPEVDTVILRPVPTVGRLDNPPSQYLRTRVVPTIMGFDPMVQVMAPEDVISAIRLALKPGVRGIFNLAGPDPAPLSAMIRRIGHRPLPTPEPLFRRAVALSAGVGISKVPSAEMDFLKYVCMVDDAAARSTLGYRPEMSLDRTLEPLRS